MRFLIVGGTAFVLDAAIVWLLTHLHLSPYWARVVSLAVSIGFTFFLNRLLTFSAKGPISIHEFIAYAGASGVGVGINYVVFALCLFVKIPWLYAMMAGTLIASTFNFFAYRYIFSKSSSKS